MDDEYKLMKPNSNKALEVYDKDVAKIFLNNALTQNMDFRKVSVNDVNNIEAYYKYNRMPFDKARLNNASLKEYVELYLQPKEIGGSIASYTTGAPMTNVVWVVHNKSNNSYGLVKFLKLDHDQKIKDKLGELK